MVFNWFKSVSTSQDAALSNNKACDGSSSSSLNQPEHSIEESKSLAAVLSSLPVAPGVKRKCLADASAFVPPSKILKAGMCSNYSCGIYEMYDCEIVALRFLCTEREPEGVRMYLFFLYCTTFQTKQVIVLRLFVYFFIYLF